MRKIGLGFALVFLISATPAQADFVYRLSPTASTIPTGGTVDISVFLMQRAGTTTLTTEGLITAGVRINYTNPPVSIASPSDITGNPAFGGFTITDQSSGTFGILFEGVIGSPVFPASGSDEIFLGTFKFTGTAAGMLTITATTDPPTVFNVTGTGTPIDAMIAPGTASITVEGVAVIPEPSSMLLLGMGAAGVGLYTRRKRKLAAAA